MLYYAQEENVQSREKTLDSVLSIGESQSSLGTMMKSESLLECGVILSEKIDWLMDRFSLPILGSKKYETLSKSVPLLIRECVQ